MTILQLRIKGQVRGGKNNMLVSKYGHHYPNPSFEKWRNDAVLQIVSQKPVPFAPIEDATCLWTFLYTPQDSRRRDLPAILDAVFHVFERTGIVKDDCLIRNIQFRQLPKSKETAGIYITIMRQV